MGMPAVDLNIYKYMLSEITLISPAWSKPQKIDPEKITSINMVCNYIGTIAPQISMVCKVPYELYYLILGNSEQIEMVFDISVSMVGSQSEIDKKKQEGSTSNETSFTEEWVKCKLKAVDQGYLHTRDVAENTSITAPISAPNQKEETDYEIRFYLFDAEKLTNYRKHKSYIISGNKNDVILEVLRSRGMKDIIMTPCGDIDQAEYAIPYGDLGNNLTSLNDIYGIYEYLFTFFMGLDRTYLIGYEGLGNDVEYGELGTVNIYVESYQSGNTSSISGGCYKDETNKVYILGTYDAQIDNVDSLVDYSEGGKFTTVIGGTGTHVTDVISNNEVEKAEVLLNRKKHQQKIHQLKNARRYLNATFSNVDLRILTPNKKYVVKPNDQHYDQDYDIAGDYYLAVANTVLTNDGNGTFAMSTSVSLVKMQ